MFVGRVRELALLEAAATSPQAEFIPIYGRRRVGKSELILRLLKAHRGLYYVGQSSSPELQKAELCREAAALYGDSLLEKLAQESWKTLLTELVERWPGPGKMLLALDEFQWMAGASPELPSVLQELWDRRWSKRKPNVLLILCGSYVGFMEREVLGKKSPLFGRRTAQIKLMPLDHRHAAALHPGWSVEDQARTYFVCGGIPWYHLQFKRARSFEQSLAAALLNDFSPLFREPDFLLREELREVETYYGILLAVATGSSRTTQIAQQAGIATSSISYYLQQLTELGYIARRYPITGRAPVRRQVRYRLADPLLSFWFRFVFPNLSFIQSAGGRRAWRERIRPQIGHHWGQCFERLCRAALPLLYRAEGLDAQAEVGEYWSKNVQIDLVSRRDDGWIDMGECKWQRVRSLPALTRELHDKLAHYPHQDGMTIGKRFFLRRMPKAQLPEIPNSSWHTLNDLYAL